MKNIFLSIALVAFIFTGCKNNTKETPATKHDSHENTEAATNTHHDDHQLSDGGLSNAWTNDIKINDGEKWEANPETNEGVQKMKQRLNTATLNTLEDYHKLATQLNEDKNYVIKNCTMQGASHDNLHIWLLPLIAKIEALTETTSVEEASTITQNIEANVNGYSNYFK